MCGCSQSSIMPMVGGSVKVNKVNINDIKKMKYEQLVTYLNQCKLKKKH